MGSEVTAAVSDSGMVEYVRVLLYFALAVFAGGSLLFISALLGPRRNTRNKLTAYECGVDPAEPNSRRKFHISFYVIATFFILFDIEAIFIIPWAAAFRDSTNQLDFLIAIGIFMFVLGIGLLYIIRKRAVHLGVTKEENLETLGVKS